MLYISIVTIIGLFVSLVLTYYLLLDFLLSDLFPDQKIRNNTVEASFCIPGVSTEHKNDLRVKPIVKSDIGFLLEFDWYSSY